MHEMSIAEGIVDIALQTMKDNEGHRIGRVEVKVGLLSGVEPDALLFCFDAVTKGTPAEGATLQIVTEPITAQCLDCDLLFEVKGYIFRCPNCGSRTVDLRTGRELQVLTIDME